MPTNIFTKFNDDPLKDIQVMERTRLILAILDNSRAITFKCLIGSGWLLNLGQETLLTNNVSGHINVFLLKLKSYQILILFTI